MDKPSHFATYERARRLANIELYTVALQRRRLRTKEPEDGEFLFRRWADFHFLVVALVRLRRAAELAAEIPKIKNEIRLALHKFDAAVPDLKKLRDVAEHFDDYALDRGRLTNINRRQLEVAVIGSTKLSWLDGEFDADEAFNAGQHLFDAIKQAKATLLE
jgi:hypothetical protein